MTFYAQDWKPRNLGGTIYYDPRKELGYWADHSAGQPMVAVPVATLRAAAQIRECGATTVMHSDEDGPLPKPQTIRCRKPEGHGHGQWTQLGDGHHNGYCEWSA